MKGYRSSFLLSLLVHLLIISFIFVIRSRREPAGRLEVVMERAEPPATERPRPDAPLTEAIPQETPLPPITGSPGKKESPESPTPAEPPVDETLWQSARETEKKDIFLSGPDRISSGDSALRPVQPFRFDPSSFPPVTRRPDPVGDANAKRNQGTHPLLINPGAFLSNDRSEPAVPPTFDFMPTLSQLQAMEYLYRKGKSTQVDLYASIKGEPITAERFNKQLERLAEKGFLAREKVSPENIFTLQSPLGSIPIEMSRRNRLNPVYEYEVKVDRERVMTFLQAQLYLLEQKRAENPPDSLDLDKRIANLKRKILVFLPGEP